MAVIGSTLHWHGSTGEHTDENGGQEEYTTVHRVTVDNPLDQSRVVLVWFRENVHSVGDGYSYGNDSGGASICRRMRAEREPQSNDVWLVVSTFAPIDNPGDNDNGGGETDPNPLNWQPRISAGTVQYKRPCQKAWYAGGLKPLGRARKAIDARFKVPPMNSALVPFNPQPEKDDSRFVVTITRNEPAFDGDAAGYFANRVNEAKFTLAHRGFKKLFKPFTAKIRDWRADLRHENGFNFWETSVTLDHREEGWYDELLDRGTLARALEDDPDGRGGTIPKYDKNQNSFSIEGVPALRRIKDIDETPINDPVLLDGDGKPLDLRAKPIKPVWLKWLCYDYTHFQRLLIFRGLIF